MRLAEGTSASCYARQHTIREKRACRWEPFGTEDCTNTVVNGVCYPESLYNPALLPCSGALYDTLTVRRKFCSKP